jgi:tRNA 2-thiouridine synthesizing protein A
MRNAGVSFASPPVMPGTRPWTTQSSTCAVLRAAKALRKVPIGGTLVLECTDPLTVIDVPHFVNQTGQALTGQEQRGSLFVFRILKQR